MNLRELYTEIILDHFKNPKNYGVLEAPTLSLDGGNTHCGDQVSFGLLIKNDVIEDIRFQSKGCAISKASSSMITEVASGKSLHQMSQFSTEELFLMLGNIIDLRRKCALLPLYVLQQGLLLHKAQGLTEISEINL